MEKTIREGQMNIDNNKGFTLVELIICVAILLIATIPIAQSIGTAQRKNSKAQSIQNATSLAESVMEEIKGSTVEELQTRYNGGSVLNDPGAGGYDSTAAKLYSGVETVSGKEAPYYILSMPQKASAEGEKFDVLATIKTSTYRSSEDGSDDTAGDANSIKLPKVEEINTVYMTAITAREINKYDEAALDYFTEYSVNRASCSVVSKEIVITKKNEAGAVNVTCDVEYTSDTGILYSREIFSGTYTPDASGVVPNNIYIFYRKYLSSNESVVVNDTATNCGHKVYFVMQDGVTDISGTSVTLSGTSISVSTNSDLGYTDPVTGDTIPGRLKDGDYELITNLDSVGVEGKIYEEKARDRVYSIEVVLTKNSEVMATLTSTKSVRKKDD